MQYDFSKDVYDIIIQGGQSNAEGCGIGSVDNPYQPCSEILMMESDGAIKTAEENIWEGNTIGNFAFSFANRYVNDGRLRSGRKLLILKSAVGGTSFYAKRWGLKDDLFLRMTEMLKASLAMNSDNRAVAFLWHQGESDTQLPDRDIHYRNLTALVKSVRQTASQKDLPFIAGDFVPLWYKDNEEICKPIVTAIRDVCSDIGNAAFVETEGLQSNSEKVGNDDTIHFSREALYQLGERYYDEFCKLCMK